MHKQLLQLDQTELTKYNMITERKCRRKQEPLALDRYTARAAASKEREMAFLACFEFQSGREEDYVCTMSDGKCGNRRHITRCRKGMTDIEILACEKQRERGNPIPAC